MKETPHLLQLLLFEYKESIAKVDGEKAANIAVQAVGQFMKFAADYLNQNRPVLMNMAQHSNYSVTLSNGRSVNLAPTVEDIKGSMAPEGQSYVMISGKKNDTQVVDLTNYQDTTDFRQDSGVVDLKTDSGAKW